MYDVILIGGIWSVYSRNHDITSLHLWPTKLLHKIKLADAYQI